MIDAPKANVKSMQVKDKPVLEKEVSIHWEKPSKHWSEKLFRNMAVAASLLICVAALQASQNSPNAQAVLNTVQEQLSLDLDESLGKLTFVSNMLPEAAMVFWNGTQDVAVMAPVQGDILHVWSAAEPYISMLGANVDVRCGLDGEVMTIAHGDGEERILRIRHPNGLETLYGNLASCFVAEGDQIYAGDLLGQVKTGEAVVFEVRQDGRSIDPTYLMKPLGNLP